MRSEITKIKVRKKGDMTDNEREKKAIQENGGSKGRMGMFKIQKKLMNRYAYSRKTEVPGGGLIPLCSTHNALQQKSAPCPSHCESYKVQGRVNKRRKMCKCSSFNLSNQTYLHLISKMVVTLTSGLIIKFHMHFLMYLWFKNFK